MTVYYDEIKIKTKGEVQIIDITKNIQKIVSKSKIKNGIVCVFIPGSTGCITTIEYEPGLEKDFLSILKKLVPKDAYYYHHETWGDYNGHSHIRSSLIGPSITVPIKNEIVVHGTWQQIVFIEMDTSPRERNIVVQIVGE